MRHANDLIAPDIRPALKRRAAETGMTIRQLSAASGINKSRLSALLNSKAPLTVSDLQVLGYALNFDPRDMIPGLHGFEVQPQCGAAAIYEEKAAHVAGQMLASAEKKFHALGEELTIDTMLRWYLRNGGRLAETDQIEKYIGVFEAPKSPDDRLITKKIGSEALAARSLNTKDPARVERYIAGLDKESRDEILFSYAQTAQRNSWQMYERNVVVDFPGAGPQFSLKYATLLMPVVAADHSQLIVNFSVLLSTKIVDPLG